MDSQQPWSDFHFLNSAFGDVLDAGRSKWIESSLVRFSYRGNKDRAINRTVKSIDGLLVEYAVPFPLTYVFGPRVLQTYGSLFVFLLQIRRAKNVLERILVRGAIASVPHLGTELKVFYAMRSKLSWFIK
jgi:gamma-tubulin complex component 5